NDKYFAGAEVTPQAAGCEGRRCLLERAVAMARDKAEFTGFDDTFNPRPIKEALASATANDDEKALLLYLLLDRAGLQPRFAYINRQLGSVVDKTFPATALLDHLILYVP